MIVFKRIIFTRFIYYHVIGWILFIGLQYFFFFNNKLRFRFEFLLLFWVSNFLLFYLNYIYLIPYLLFRKKTVTYVISILVISIMFFYSQSFIAVKQIQRPFRKEFSPESFYREKPEFDLFK